MESFGEENHLQTPWHRWVLITLSLLRCEYINHWKVQIRSSLISHTNPL